MNAPTISVVIPVYNEEENLKPLLAGLAPVMDKLRIPYELIFVNDASSDASLEALKQLRGSYPYLRIASLKSRSGQSAAFDAGFKIAQGDIVITMDADLQYDPEDIPRLLERIPSFDVVCGWRKKRNDPWLKRLSTKVANAVRNKVSQEQVRDIGCSLRVMKKSFLSQIKMYDGMHRFLPTLLKMQGATVSEIPVRHLPRKFGRSKYNLRNRSVRAFLDLLAVTWMKKRNLRYTMEVIK
ncbi:MAG: glycosyltransferase family 2 protein [Candidatus Omnitrophota bacterium]